EVIDARKIVLPKSEDRGQRHAMDVATWRSSGSIDVAVRIDPDQPDALLLLSIKLRDAAHRTYRNGMIASQDHWNHAFLQGLQNKLSFFRAGGRNFLQVLRVRIAFFLGLGNRDRDVSTILDDQAKRLELRFESGNANCGWTHVDATARLSEIKRNAYDTDLARRDLCRCAVRAGGEFFEDFWIRHEKGF